MITMTAALSVRQPWAAALLNGLKPVENRSWPLLYGGIIGEITFGPSVRDHPSEWAEAACWHWPVVTVRELAFYPCRGQLRIFTIEYTTQ